MQPGPFQENPMIADERRIRALEGAIRVLPAIARSAAAGGHVAAARMLSAILRRATLELAGLSGPGGSP
jgi:hypothetical protein